MDINIRIAGEAGQGVQTTGSLLVGSLAEMGLHVLSTQSYMSRIRGGLNWFDVRVGDGPLWAGRDKAELLVALTPLALPPLADELSAGGLILLDAAEAEAPAIAMHFTDVARQLAKSPVMANSVAAGAAFAILGYDLEKLVEFLTREFERKGHETVEKNVACARRGAELAQPYAGRIPSPAPAGAPAFRFDGASAIGLGAATAGVKFVAAYPMTPSTATLTYLAHEADRFGMLVEQAEDEVAAVNMLCGATYAGVPALATTSGGGFALMVEGLSLAGMLELPIVIMVGQRPGPATGLPTRTCQTELQFVLRAGHGEFPRAVYAPGTVEQSYTLTRRAVETAHRFQTPALILTDQFLQDMQMNFPPLDETYRPIDRGIVEGGADYRRYAVTENGISPRAIPGGAAVVVVDSDEHTEAGHISDDLLTHVAQADKRLRKAASLAAEAMPPELYGATGPETLLICWGSTYGPCREAVDTLNARGQSVAMLFFPQIWPLPLEHARQGIQGRRRVVCIEGNATGQFAALLREQGLIGPCEFIGRHDGYPFTADYILDRLEGRP